MSGSFKSKDGFVYFPHCLNQMEETMFAMQFDVQTDFDVQDIQQEIKEANFLRKVCLYKVLLFIPEYFLHITFFGLKTSSSKIKELKLYWKYFRKQMTLEKFKKDLTSLANNGKII